jgi:adenine/guanine phosphoribosyltransferase-like PRPP-binding protein
MSVDPSTRYVVIDDVLTTGATLHACALTLRKAGAGLVDAAALAQTSCSEHGQQPLPPNLSAREPAEV